MDTRRKRRLLKVLDEVSNGESEYSESESELVSTDDDVTESTYANQTESNSDNTDDSISQKSNNVNEAATVGGDIGPDELNDDEWQDDTAEIPNFEFDDSQSGTQIHFISHS